MVHNQQRMLSSLAVMGIIFVAAASAPAARAETWKSIGETNDGTIFEIDVDSVKKLDNGNVLVNTASGGDERMLTFDCKGKAFISQRWFRFPEGSALNGLSNVACMIATRSVNNNR